MVLPIGQILSHLMDQAISLDFTPYNLFLQLYFKELNVVALVLLSQLQNLPKFF
jgi:hypothetical protein